MRENLTFRDEELVAEAGQIIRQRYRKDWHVVGSALRTRSGRVFSAVHLEAYVGRIAVCAEAIALGMAVKEGDSGVDTVVAVLSSGEIVAPCGMCRELISDYSSKARVIVPGDGGAEVVSVLDLLPRKYLRPDGT